MHKAKNRGYTCGLATAIAGLSLFSYHVRELLAAMALFSLVFFLATMVALGGFYLWRASDYLVTWTGPSSQDVVAFSRRLIAAYARS